MNDRVNISIITISIIHLNSLVKSLNSQIGIKKDPKYMLQGI